MLDKEFFKFEAQTIIYHLYIPNCPWLFIYLFIYGQKHYLKCILKKIFFQKFSQGLIFISNFIAYAKGKDYIYIFLPFFLQKKRAK